MSPDFKRRVYSKGNDKQVECLIYVGGMDEEEAQLYRLLHKMKSDAVIEMEMHIGKSAREQLEERVAYKFTMGLLSCLESQRTLSERTHR